MTGGLFAGFAIPTAPKRLHASLGLVIAGVIWLVAIVDVTSRMGRVMRIDLVLISISSVLYGLLFALPAIGARAIVGRHPGSSASVPRGAPATAADSWKMAVSALTPIFALIGTVISAYLTYLSALAQKGP